MNFEKDGPKWDMTWPPLGKYKDLSHLSGRRYCLEGREPVQKVEWLRLELTEEAEERQNEGEDNLMINGGLSQSVKKINHKER